MRFFQVAAVGMVALIALAACASPSGLAPSTPSPSITETATVQAVQERETGLTRPAAVFGGQCDLLFSEAELASVMGESLVLGNNHWDEFWAGDELFAQHGGFECTWYGTNARVIALVLPKDAVDYTPREYTCAETHDADALSCPVEVVVNGIRLSGLSTLGQDLAAATTARDSLLALFTEKASLQTPVPVPLAAAGSWQLTLDCAAIASGADFSAVPGLGADTVDVGAMSAGKDTSQAEEALVVKENFCAVQGESATVSFIPMGGARWLEQQVAAREDATPLTLEGVEVAYGVPFSDGLTLVYAFAGPNMLMFQVRHTSNAAGIATALIMSLDATALR